MKISVFRVETGQILRTVECPVGMANLQIQPGEDWIEGHHALDRFYVQGFSVVAMSQRPSEHHVFDYSAKQWTDPRTPETEWPLVRARRNQLLTASDWTQLPDVPLDTKQVWVVYRQALRDITQQADPFNIVWPVPPA